MMLLPPGAGIVPPSPGTPNDSPEWDRFRARLQADRLRWERDFRGLCFTVGARFAGMVATLISLALW
jgi:hypothetical protein